MIEDTGEKQKSSKKPFSGGIRWAVILAAGMGIASIAFGCYLVYPPLTFIVIGVLLLAEAYMTVR